MRALLAGPTTAEAKRELTTQVPAGTPLRSVRLDDGVATLDLGEKFAAGTSVESLSARVAQVVLTATRFPNVRSVRLLVKGGTPLGLFPGIVTRYPLTAKTVAAPNVPPPSTPEPPSGGQSEQIRALQQRLDELGFLTRDAVDGKTGPRTTSAVVAFQKWAGLTRDGAAGPATLAALATASRPAPIGRAAGRRLEVLLDRQLTLVIEGDRVTRVLDASTGKPGFETLIGSWKVARKEERSWSVPYKVWLPWAIYIIGGYAFHEYPDVPPEPASHGCVRIPSWDAEWLYRQTPFGTLVTVIGRSR
ncbi:MAG: L,D-transpeptidase family protein [Gaiellaceae bacterium MAG52_C11]|nr:L,D-transpeptidase family protein [Candidatus Gaiellasilicea maunaloa]